MFTQKLQNPFLKPTPYFSTNNYNAHSYAPPLPPTSKYSGYSAYDTSNVGRFDSYSNSIDRVPDITQPSRSYASIDIDDMLRNNPFNRPTNPIFNTSSANSYSPAKYDNTKISQNSRTNSYQRIQFNDSYSNTRRNYAINEGVSNQHSQTRLTPKKYDNYLSTSSAESATTYINKIYQLDDDRSDVSGPITNPFHRKNLIQEKKYEREARPTNSYDNAAIKYIAGQRQYQKPKYLQNKFLKQEHSVYQSKNKLNEYLPLAKDYSDLEYKRENFGSKKDLNQPNSFRGYQKSKNNDMYQRENYQKVQSFGSENRIEDKYDNKYQNKYEDNYYESKFSKYNKYEDLPKENFGSKNNIQRHQYIEDKLHSRKYDNINKDLQRSDSKFDFQQSQHNKKSKKFINAEVKDQFPFNDKHQQSKCDKYEGNYQNYKYSFKREADEYMDRDMAIQSKKSQERINFGDQDKSFESSKLKNKQYSGAFQTLGGVKPRKYNQESYYRQNQVPSKKLISSQVEQFQSKPKNHLESLQKRDTSKFGYYEQQQEQDYEHQLKSKKGPVRDTSENYPSTLYYKGMVFSRVQVK